MKAAEFFREVIECGIGDVCGRLDDVCEKLSEISGTGLYNSLTDVCAKIDSISDSGYTLYDVCSKLDSIEGTIIAK